MCFYGKKTVVSKIVPGLINKVDICRFSQTEGKGNALKLTTRKVLDLGSKSTLKFGLWNNKH